MAEMKHYTLGEYVKLLEEKGMLAECNLQGKDGEEIKLLTYDSREVTQGTLFICKGAAFKAEYLKNSMNQGAVCYVSEKKYELEKEVRKNIIKRDKLQKLAGFYKIYPNTITVDVTECKSAKESAEKVYSIFCEEGVKNNGVH